MSEIKSYTETFQMKYGEGDFLGRVRPATLMRYVEHVSLKHAELLGVSQAFTQSHHMVFLIAKQAIEFKRMPRSNETLTFVTQPEQAKRVTFRRVTLIYDAEGQEVACVDSIWVLMDTDTHRLLRRAPVAFDAVWAENIAASVDMKLTKPAQLITVGKAKAVYTLCDANGHINNANYFDLVCDAFMPDDLRKREIRRMVLNYHREVLLGEEIELQTGESASGVYFVGSKNQLPAFEALCQFAD